MTDWSRATTWAGASVGGCFEGQITSDWSQGRSAFGGIVAASAVRAARSMVADDRVVRSVLVTFVGPANVGPVGARCQVLRAGRSLTFVEVQVTQGEAVCAVVQAVFGVARETLVPWPAASRDDLPSQGAIELPYIQGITPSFTKYYSYRWTGGPMPFTGGADAKVEGWIRLREAAAFDEELALGLIDAWPPAIWGLARAPAPASTVTWQINFVGDSSAVAAGASCFFASRATWSGHGYADLEGELYAPDGTLIAVSRQMMAEFTVRGNRRDR